jgi:hypothetical protein
MLILFTLEIKAQPDFKSGYIVLKSGDTLKGTIDYKGNMQMGSECKFKPVNKDSIFKYRPNDLIEYRFNDSKFFISRYIKNGNDSINVFLEFLFKGRLNIFRYRNSLGDHYYIEKKDYDLIELPYDEGIRYQGDTAYFYESKTHNGLLFYYLQDAPSLQSQIIAIKKPDQNSLIRLANKYQSIVCKDEKCIIYEKQLPSFKIYVEGLGGIAHFYKYQYYNSKVTNIIYFNGGCLLHIWMPNENEKLFLRTGILFSEIKITNELLTQNKLYYKIPIQFEYIYPKGIFRPKISYGINLYQIIKYQNVSLTGGFNLKLYENFGLSLISDFEFFSTMLVLPRKNSGYSILAGLYILL